MSKRNTGGEGREGVHLMSGERKRYTAQEYRDLATQVDDECADAIANEMTIASGFDVDAAQHLRDMLRQAADAEKELKLALVTVGNQSDEIAQLKARLDAVAEACEKVMFDRELKHQGMFFFVEIDGKKMPVLQSAICETVNAIPAILRAGKEER